MLDELVEAARADQDVIAAALIGSTARGETDAWSDIDLALRLRPGVDPVDAAQAWTRAMRQRHAVADTLDVWAGPALYRVFLLSDSLQIDLSFWPHDAFRATGESHRLLFGAILDEDPVAPPDLAVVLGWGWLYALHARSAINRGRRWQALQMIGDLRTQVVALACARHGLPMHEGRGVDRLPPHERAALLPTLPATLEGGELARALAAAVDLLARESRLVDGPDGAAIDAVLDVLRRSIAPPSPVAR